MVLSKYTLSNKDYPTTEGILTLAATRDQCDKNAIALLITHDLGAKNTHPMKAPIEPWYLII